MTTLSRRMVAEERAPRWTLAGPCYVKNVIEFKDWLSNARRGEWCYYWHGFLMCDREAPPLLMSAERALIFSDRANAIGEATWTAQIARKVTLVQQRSPLGGFRYFAIRV